MPNPSGRADRSKLQNSLCAARHWRGSARLQRHWTVSADYTHEEGNHAYRAYSLCGIASAAQVFRSDNRSSYNALMLHLQGNVSQRFNLMAQLHSLESADLGMRAGRAVRLCEWSLRSAEPFRSRRLRPFGRRCSSSLRACRYALLPGGLELTTLTQAECCAAFHDHDSRQ